MKEIFPQKPRRDYTNLENKTRAVIITRMKCAGNERNQPRHQKNLDNLDRALHDLGMLSAVTEARREYLRETQSDYCMMRLNTRYVSNVTVGYCMKRATQKNRLCPYVLPARHRTKSENSDPITSENSEYNRDFKNSLMEPSTSSCKDMFLDSNICHGKRCQSLENLNLSDPVCLTRPETLQEVECVSTQIKNLQVDE